MKELKFEELSIGTKVYDKDFDCTGVVKECSDIHNVFVEYDEGGSGLYCLKDSCVDDVLNGNFADKLYTTEGCTSGEMNRTGGEAGVQRLR